MSHADTIERPTDPAVNTEDHLMDVSPDTCSHVILSTN